MMFSKACQYGIRATLYIAQQSLSGKRSSLKDIARAIDSPEAFTAKILQQLARNKLLKSVKGPYGGFELSEAQLKETNLNQIVNAIDGNQLQEGCGLGLSECNAETPCPLHDKFVVIKSHLSKMLKGTSLHDLATSLDNGKAFLNTIVQS